MKRLVGLVLLGALLACSDDGPKGGQLKLTLATPNSGADGAILLTVTGPATLTSASTAGGLRLFAEPLATTNHFALTGTLANGVVLTIGIRDLKQASSYSAAIQQVAAASTYQLRPLAGYSLTIAP